MAHGSWSQRVADEGRSHRPLFRRRRPANSWRPAAPRHSRPGVKANGGSESDAEVGVVMERGNLRTGNSSPRPLQTQAETRNRNCNDRLRQHERDSSPVGHHRPRPIPAGYGAVAIRSPAAVHRFDLEWCPADTTGSIWIDRSGSGLCRDFAHGANYANLSAGREACSECAACPRSRMARP